MESKINLSAKAIINKLFTRNVKGYDPLEVDKFLDSVADDYRLFEKALAEYKLYVAELETLVKTNKDKLVELEVENAKYKKRLGNIKDDPKVTMQNLEYIKRINVLETELYRLGVDPTKL
ncbi:MAG: DivIVA domain-containing protein [Bacilli bacterium]|jgi:DivIVA domain-containing protein